MKVKNELFDIETKGALLYGTHVGEHSFEYDDIWADIREAVEERGMSFIAIRTPRHFLPEEWFYEWAEYLAAKRIYFFFFYTVQRFFHDAKEGERCSQLTPSMVERIEQIAGKYFLGDMLGEVGSVYACKSPGYYVKGIHAPKPPQNVRSMQEAKDNFVNMIRDLIAVDRALGIEKVSSVEATMLHSYTVEAGVKLPIAELMLSSPEEVLPSLRGTAAAYKLPLWGTYIAHEWYSGYFHDDALKAGRLDVCYKYAYMQGTGLLCLESGDKDIDSYGDHRPATSALSRKTYAFVQRFRDFVVDGDVRPEGGPRVRVAFIQGNLDGYGSWGSATVWAQFEGEQWAHDGAEHSWRHLRDLAHGREWWEADNYEVMGRDTTASVPMGAYDILPASAPVDVMQNYDLLVFLGWNTMTDDLYARLTAYVRGGGKLLCTAAHLNMNPVRGGEIVYPNGGDLTELFGVRMTGNVNRSPLGIKFYEKSEIPHVVLPWTATRVCDPLYAGGVVNYAEIERAGCRVCGMANDSFWDMSPIEENEDRPVSHAGVMDLSGVAEMRAASPNYPAVVENKCGEGYTMLIATTDYPGAGAVYPQFRAMLRAMLRAVSVTDSVRVSAPETLRYTVWGEGENELYLLNTSHDVAALVHIEKDGKRHFVSVPPLRMKHVRVSAEGIETLSEI